MNSNPTFICFVTATFKAVLPFRFTVAPQHIDFGVTKTLLLNCTLSKLDVSHFSVLSSLILSRPVDNNVNNDIPLASITSITGHTTVHIDKALGNGVLNAHDESYISLQLPYPSNDMAGEYECEAHGIDMSWAPLTLTKNVIVTSSEINLNVLRDEIRNNLISIDLLEKKTQILDEIKSRLDTSRHWFFKISDIYKGRRYYLSQQDPIGRSEQSMATCVLYGGYLAEIEDLDEMSFVRGFIKQFSGFILVLIGGTFQTNVNEWRYRFSNTTVPDSIIKLRDTGRFEICLYMYEGFDWYAFDDFCYYTYPSIPTRFLCEIPEEATEDQQH